MLTEGTLSLHFGDIRVSARYGVPTHYNVSQEVLLLEAPAGGLNGAWNLRCYGRKVSDGRFNVWLPTMEEVTDHTAFLQPNPDLTPPRHSTLSL